MKRDFSCRAAIVGGGLSGLLAALLLEQQGCRDCVLLEARPGLGGRILSVDATGSELGATVFSADRFDLGPAWFWPDMQPQLAQLVNELGLACFAQHEHGDTLLERSRHAPAQRVGGDVSAPTAMRLVGGMGALVSALHHRLEPGRVVTGQTVRRMAVDGSQLELECENAAGVLDRWRVDHVLLALPPRLAAHSLGFTPALPPALTREWRATATWMAPHAKYIAVYDTPFWREQGLSGAARSALGPMAEIHDASMPGGHAALFGFLGVPAPLRRGVAPDLLRSHCRAQLRRLFGERAATPIWDGVKDWAADPLTATHDDQQAAEHHAGVPPSTAADGPWQGRLTGIGSEWSPQFPGYLAGAVDAASRGVSHCLANSARVTPPRPLS